MPLELWDDAFSISVYLIERLPTTVNNGISLMEFLFKFKPDYKFLKVFGCLCFPSLRSYNNHKIESRSTPCLFLGYNNLHQGYKCLSQLGRLYISRHVLFYETFFPFPSFFSKSTTSLFSFIPFSLPILSHISIVFDMNFCLAPLAHSHDSSTFNVLRLILPL